MTGFARPGCSSRIKGSNMCGSGRQARPGRGRGEGRGFSPKVGHRDPRGRQKRVPFAKKCVKNAYPGAESPFRSVTPRNPEMIADPNGIDFRTKTYRFGHFSGPSYRGAHAGWLAGRLGQGGCVGAGGCSRAGGCPRAKGLPRARGLPQGRGLPWGRGLPRLAKPKMRQSSPEGTGYTGGRVQLGPPEDSVPSKKGRTCEMRVRTFYRRARVFDALFA